MSHRLGDERATPVTNIINRFKKLPLAIKLTILGIAVTAVIGATQITVSAINTFEDKHQTESNQKKIAASEKLGLSQDWGTSNNHCGIEQLAIFDPIDTAWKQLQPNSGGFAGLPQGAEMWHQGELDIILSSGGNSSYSIKDIKISEYTIVKKTPSAFYQRGFFGCGGLGDTAIMLKLNGDTRTMNRISSSGNITKSSSIDKNVLFDPFSVNANATGSFRIFAKTCKTNFRFSLSIEYVTAGQNKTQNIEIGPFEVYASNSDVPLYIDDPRTGFNQGQWDDPRISAGTFPCVQ